MYLWKYWRETRILFGICMLGLGIALYAIYHARIVASPGETFSMLLPGVLTGIAVPATLVAWLYGSFGVGRNLGEKSGFYLFSRPRSHAFFIWRDWSFGLAQLLLFTILFNLVIAYQIHRLQEVFESPQHSILFSIGTVSLSAVVAQNTLAIFLLVALVFSLSYFSTILVKNVKGIILAASLIVVYTGLRIYLRLHEGIDLPGMLPVAYAESGNTVTGFADHFPLFFAIRAAIVPLLPFAAQILLEKTDIQ